jgi:hypothetical protein
MTLSNKKEKSGRGRKPKLSRDQLTDVLVSFAEQALEKEEPDETVLLKVNRITAELEINHDINVSSQTVREKGISEKGYYPTKFDSIDYNKLGDKSLWGLLMKPEEFIKEVEEVRKEEELKEKKEAILN